MGSAAGFEIFLRLDVLQLDGGFGSFGCLDVFVFMSVVLSFCVSRPCANDPEYGSASAFHIPFRNEIVVPGQFSETFFMWWFLWSL